MGIEMGTGTRARMGMGTGIHIEIGTGNSNRMEQQWFIFEQNKDDHQLEMEIIFM